MPNPRNPQNTDEENSLEDAASDGNAQGAQYFSDTCDNHESPDDCPEKEQRQYAWGCACDLMGGRDGNGCSSERKRAFSQAFEDAFVKSWLEYWA